MTDLSANAPLRFLGEPVTEEFVLDSSAAQHAYKGCPMIIDQSEDTVYPRVFLDATTVVATDIFVGIALEEKAIAAGDTENVKIKLAVGPSVVGFKSTVYTNADLGDTVYMSDSGTLSATAADNPELGKLVIVRDGFAFVELTAPKICADA